MAVKRIRQGSEGIQQRYECLIIPYAVDLRSGGAFFIDPTIGKKPLGESCSIDYYGDISATLNAPSSTALGDTITLSVTITSLSGSSPREVNFYISGDGQTENIYSTSVTNGNTYSTSWTDNIIGNLTFCANYLYDRETCDYDGHVYTNYGYSSLGSKSIHGGSIINGIGYMGNGVIYIGTANSNQYFNTTEGVAMEKDYDSYGVKCEQNYISLATGYTENYVHVASGSYIEVVLCLGSAGGIDFYNNPLEPWELFSYTNLSARLVTNGRMTVEIENSFNNAVNLTEGSHCGGISVAGGIKDLMAISASLLPPSLDFAVAIAALLIPTGVATDYQETSIGQGTVFEHFLPNPLDLNKSGGSFGAGTQIQLDIYPSAYSDTSSLTVRADNHVICKNGGASVSYTYSIDPSFAIRGHVKKSGNYLKFFSLYLKNDDNGNLYKIITTGQGYYIFYANANT